MTGVCEIPHPITIVSAQGHVPPLDDRLEHSLKIIPIDKVAVVLNQMIEGVPTMLEAEYSESYGQQVIAYFCTPFFVARCVVKESIYLLLRLNAPEFIYRHLPNWRCMRVRPTSWKVRATGHRSVLSGYRTGYQRIRQHFQAHLASFDRRTHTENLPSPTQQAYLEMLRDHIALTRRVEEDRARNQPAVVFTEIAGTGAERVVRDIYTFQLSGPNPFSPRDFVWVGMGGMDLEGRKKRGRVKAVEDRQVTLKFEDQVDLARISLPGVMGFEFNDVQQRVQERALDALRDGEALNPHLLDVIVDGEYTQYQAPAESEEGSLNPSQSWALHCAQAMDDVFLVLGPPGTGKTRTITELVGELAEQGQRTLVTSKNNLAVDNVLVQLKGLRVIRIGHEDMVAPKARHLLIDEQARAMQQEIVAATDEPFQQLDEAIARWKEAETEIARLRKLPPLWSDHLGRWEEARQAVRAVQMVVWKQYEPRLKRRAAEAHQAHRRAVQAVRRADRATGLLEWALARRDWPLVSVIAMALSNWLAERAAQVRQRAEAERAAFQRVARRYEADVARYRTAGRESQPVLAAKERLQEAEATIQPLAEAARSGVERIHAHLTPSPIALPEPVAATPEALLTYLDRLATLKEVLEWRHRLLAEWRERLQERRQALYGVLIRSADVVGTTCIGIATKAPFRDLKFNTVIADEAGQIQAFDLLVPLVRARRAVLVGDHKQLPPFVDEDVQALVDEEDEESVALLEQSLFERLFDAAPDTHKAMLDTQYRMPASIADFISEFFYRGKYHTAPSLQSDPADPFFSRPICFVDTGHRKRYRERKGQGEETGYANPGEAEVLARLADAYLSRSYAIGVIVPYRLQMTEVRRALRLRRPDVDESRLRDIVATVDSFQGQQRNTILFGFTRSNNWGGVGFLRELRRLNVTITRVQRQLVLVGDSVTLTRAGDLGFREFANALLEYVRRKGQYLEIEQLEEILRGRDR